MKASLKWVMILSVAVALSACSSKSKDQTTTAVPGNNTMASGVGGNPDFDDSQDARMAKILGIEKNTIYFDFDSDVIKADYLPILQANANYLKGHPNARILIAGNADPRGSREYNIGLGQRRADVVRQRLVMMGVNANQMKTVSYGSEKPAVSGNDDYAYSQDRRDDISYEVVG
ncbi:MAG: peptidoglycan-associated lipoprotein Pal [Gammaproteobacteria bacterium]|nr:peptidoglycan-associated lipoprotein Pal [Gammaproteobacteria bacterium]